MALAPVNIKIENFSDDEELMAINDATSNNDKERPTDEVKIENIFFNAPRSGVPELFTNGPTFISKDGIATKLDVADVIPKAKVNEAGRVECLFCPKTFKSNGIYKLHEKIHTGRGAYSCNVCGKVFGQRSHFVDHVAIHSSIRPFDCEICSARFKEKNTLRRHQQRKHEMFGWEPKKSKRNIQPKPFNPNNSTYEKLKKITEKLRLNQQENVVPKMILPPKVELPMKVFLSGKCQQVSPVTLKSKNLPQKPKITTVKPIPMPPLRHLPEPRKISPKKVPIKLVRLPATELAKIAKAKTIKIKTEPVEDIKPQVMSWSKLPPLKTIPADIIKKEELDDEKPNFRLKNLPKLLTPKTELFEFESVIPKLESEDERCSSPEIKLEDFLIK